MERQRVMRISGLVTVLFLFLFQACTMDSNQEPLGVIGQQAIGDCTVTASTNPTSPQTVGTSITITGTANCTSGTPEYKFYAKAPGGSWSIAQDWNSSNTLNWNTTGSVSGTHLIQVWARRQGETFVYEGASNVISYDLTGGTGSCTAVTASTNPASPQTTGTHVTFTFTPTCSGGVTAEYKIYRKTSSGGWTVERDWNTSTSYIWDTTSASTGIHNIQVWIRRSGSTATFEGASSVLNYELTAGSTTCTAVSLTPSPASPQSTGTQITFTASATCGGGATAEYKFYRRSPAGSWSIAQDWNSNPTLNWDTTGAATGTYLLQVWTRAQGSVAVYEGVSPTLNYTINAASLVSTYAGNGTSGFADGTGSVARFKNLFALCSDSNGNIYVADSYNHRIRKIAAGGVTTTIAGTGTAGFQDGPAASAQFKFPYGIAISDDDNTLYISDSFNYRIRTINLTTLVVSTLAGSGVAGFANGTGAAAQFVLPYGLDVDSSGNVYVSDKPDHRIRKITPAGVVTTFAGSGVKGFADDTGTAAQFSDPWSLATDSSGNVYVADYGNHRIRKITPAGVVTTFAGSGSPGFGDGLAGVAKFQYPYGVDVDASDNVFVADTVNHRIRKITPAGAVSTIAGTGVAGYTEGAATTVAQFNLPFDVAVDSSGNVYIADYLNHSVRKLAP